MAIVIMLRWKNVILNSLHGEICEGYSYGKKEVKRCQGNLSEPVPIRAVPSLRMIFIVKAIRNWLTNTTTNTSGILNQTNAMDVLGNEYEIDTSKAIPFVRSAKSKAG